MSVPPMVIRPLSGSARRTSSDSSVDFPPPDGRAGQAQELTGAYLEVSLI